METYKFDKKCLYSAKNRNSVPDSDRVDALISEIVNMEIILYK